MKVLGLDLNKTYTNDNECMTLRYGKFAIMPDRDEYGAELVAFAMNFIHFHWPALFKKGFIQLFLTPILRVEKHSKKFYFYCDVEYEYWKNNNKGAGLLKLKQFTTIGIACEKDTQYYFNNLNRRLINSLMMTVMIN